MTEFEKAVLAELKGIRETIDQGLTGVQHALEAPSYLTEALEKLGKQQRKRLRDIVSQLHYIGDGCQKIYEVMPDEPVRWPGPHVDLPGHPVPGGFHQVDSASSGA